MTNQQHPIKPSFESLQDWERRFYDQQLTFDELVTEVYKAGADQELEAGCEWLNKSTVGMAELLRAARRPKPPSLKEQALKALREAEVSGHLYVNGRSDTIRRALEQLND